MRMLSFDFLSSSPQSFIFQRRSNRTNFGGVLSLLYLIVFLITSSFYFVGYFNQDNYLIQYLYHERFITDEEILKRVESDRYNPKLNFCPSIIVKAEKEIENRFKIRRNNNILKSEVNLTQCLNYRMTDIDLLLVYDCLDANMMECSIDYEKIYSDVAINLDYNGFFLLHQNKTAPIYRFKEESTHRYRAYFELNNTMKHVQEWKTIRYKEEKDFFSIFKKQEDNDYIGLGMKSFYLSKMTTRDGKNNVFLHAFDFNAGEPRYYKVLGRLKFDIDFHHYDEYKRTPKSIWDTVANICSLSMTVLNVLFYSLMNYFSNNVDNCNIMEKILFNSNPKFENKQSHNNNEFHYLKDYPSNPDLNKEKNLIDKSNGLNANDNKNLLSINDEIINEKDIELINKDFNEGFPRLNFFDYLFNEIYDDKCCKLEKKRLIEKCNEIVSKYYSIECIVSYLMKLENLLKDYRWNNPELNNLDNNILISDLKNIISRLNINKIITFNEQD